MMKVVLGTSLISNPLVRPLDQQSKSGQSQAQQRVTVLGRFVFLFFTSKAMPIIWLSMHAYQDHRPGSSSSSHWCTHHLGRSRQEC